MTTADPFAGMSEVKANWMKFNKIGDFVKGTLVDIRKMKSQLPGKEGTLTNVYELRAHVGSFHNTDDSKQIIEPAIVIAENEFWMIGGKDQIDNQMRNVKKGQIIGFRFAETKPSKTKGFAAQKIIKVLIGAMDPNYMGETSADVDPNTVPKDANEPW